MPWTTADSPSLHYELTGTGSQVLILFHELGGSLESFRDVAVQLERRFRILLWDQRGSGLSEKPVSPYPMEAHADDLDRLIGTMRLPPPYLLCGVAAGASIAFLFAERKSRGDIRGAVFCSPSIGVDSKRRDYLLQRAALARQQGMTAVVESVLSRSFPEEMRRSSSAYDGYRARFLSNDPVSYALANEALSNLDIGDRLGRVSYPVRLVAGDDDRLRPADFVAALRDRIPAAEMSVVRSGHLMCVQAPFAVAAAITSLDAEIGSGRLGA